MAEAGAEAGAEAKHEKQLESNKFVLKGPATLCFDNRFPYPEKFKQKMFYNWLMCQKCTEQKLKETNNKKL